MTLNLLLIWCFWFKIGDALKVSSGFIYVDVLSHDNFIERKRAKDNLEAVVELCQRYVEDYSLFDRQWYEMRANRRFRGGDCDEGVEHDQDTAGSMSDEFGYEQGKEDGYYEENSARTNVSKMKPE